MRLVYLFALIIVVSALFVSAVTLTKDATEKVIITKAYRILVEDSESPELNELVFGYADIYAKDDPSDEPAARLAIFIYDGVAYRATGFGLTYNQNGGVLREEGGGSIVHPDGTEENEVFNYFIRFNDAGDLSDLEFKFSLRENGVTYREGGRILKLKQVLKVSDEEIEWRPQ